MKRLVLSLLVIVGIALSEDVGIKTVSETGADGNTVSHLVVFTGTEYITLNTTAEPPTAFPSDTGELWVDRNHRYAIAQSVTTQPDGLGVFAYWDLNAQRAAYYRTLGSGVPAWESPGIFAQGFGGHEIGAGASGRALSLAALNQVDEWSKLSGMPRWTSSYPGPVFASSKVSQDGSRVAVANSSGMLKVFNATTGDSLWAAHFNEGSRLQGIAISTDGSIIAVTVYDSCTIFENGARRGAIPIGVSNTGTQFAAKISGDGKYLVTGDYLARVRLFRWNGASYDMMWSASVGNPWVTDINISRDGSTIAAGTGYANGKAVVFDSSSATPLWSFQGFGGYGAEVASCAVSDNGQRIAFACWGDTVQSGSTYVLTVHDRSSSTPLTGVQRDEEVGSLFCCDISADGQYVAAGGKAVHAYRFGNGGEVYAFLIGHTPANNAGVLSIDAPGPLLQVGNPVSPLATVQNFGDSAATFNTFLEIRGSSGIVQRDSVLVTGLEPGSSQQVSFADWTPAEFDSFSFTVATALAGDEFRNDDTLVLNAKCYHDARAGRIWPPFDTMTSGYSFNPMVKVYNNGSYTDDVTAIISIYDSAGTELLHSDITISGIAPGDSELFDAGAWAASSPGRYFGTAVARTDTADFIHNNDSTARLFCESWELIYDDASPEAYYWVGRQDNDKFYCRFTPTAPAPFSIAQGRIFVNLANQPFAYVAVVKDDGGRPDTSAELQRVENVSTPNAPGWITFDLDITRDDNSDLWLVANWPNNSPGLGVGADADQPRDYRSYFSSNVDTFFQWQAHDWMMRLTQVPGTGISDNSALKQLSFSLSALRPNPFRGRTAIEYSLANQSRVSVRIYDPAGRAVRTVLNADQSSGRYRISWDGRDDFARALPAGIYFCRMEVENAGFTASRKLLLLP